MSYRTPEEHEIAFLQHVVDSLYESLGPANDDILQMAYDDWVGQGNELPDGYSLSGHEDEDDSEDEDDYNEDQAEDVE